MGFHTRDLWKLNGFQEARLPKMEAKCPLPDAGQSLCLLLLNISE
jgi:hypothetical protein